ncbi:MAG TPA: hypothetical protein VFD92_17850 [Candidatus Binatia bacterium]|nr:hypothetical protein [Candidatus Binatia bacterium]
MQSTQMAQAAPAPSPTPITSATVAENLVSATAKVKKIDHKTRHVTLQLPDGKETTVKVDESVRNLPQVKKGDEVTIAYYESLAYRILKPGEADSSGMAAEAVRAEPGKMPGGAAAAAVTTTATITGIDRETHMVTLKGANGKTVTVKARDPRRLEAVKVGDRIEITYTEALAVSVEKVGKAKKK